MRDSFGRQVDYLRLSVTQRCDLRCAYCRPARDCESPRELCDLEELTELAAACVELGVKKIRLTGGEPLVRPDLVELVGRLRALPGLEELCLTTNGQRLAELAAPLRAAGLDRLNISLDSLRPARYRALTGGELERTLAGIEAAEAAGFTGLRLNTVLLRGVNEDELAELAGLARTHPWSVRFIELMPIGPGAAMPEAFLPAARVLEAVPELREAGQAGRPARSGEHCSPWADEATGPGAGIRDQGSGIRGGSEFRVQSSAPPVGGGVLDAPRGSTTDEATGNRQQATGGEGTAPSAPLRCAQDDEYGALSARRDGSQPSAPWGQGTGDREPGNGDGVARLYTGPGWAGTVGLIAPMSRAFCAACSRVRITADGRLKPCLHSPEEFPLRGLRGAALREAILAAVGQKPARHRLHELGRSGSLRTMEEIGG